MVRIAWKWDHIDYVAKRHSKDLLRHLLETAMYLELEDIPQVCKSSYDSLPTEK